MDSKSAMKLIKKDQFIFNRAIIEDDNKLEEEYLEKRLENDIENDCHSEIKKIYVDKLEIKEIPDKELIIFDKQEIIDHKNYQIQKLKAYIISLEKEKEDLINNFKETTNFLLEKIKQDEFNEFGVRPQTSQIVDNIFGEKDKFYNKTPTNQSRNSNNNFIYGNGINDSNSISDGKSSNGPEKKKIDVFNFEDNKEFQMARCPNCTKEFPQDKFIAHSLYCLRKNHTCKICKEVIAEDKKKDHILEWRSNEVIIINKIKLLKFKFIFYKILINSRK
jgi:hypothetical protein